MSKDNHDVHARHQPSQPEANEEFDTPQAAPKEPKPKKSNTQAIRDAHFEENGVKADGTGGKVPESEL